MLVWISDLGMKKGFPEITGNPICCLHSKKDTNSEHEPNLPIACFPLISKNFRLQRFRSFCRVVLLGSIADGGLALSEEELQLCITSTKMLRTIVNLVFS